MSESQPATRPAATTRRRRTPQRQVHHRIKKLIMDESLTAEAVVSYMADAQPTGDYYTEGGSAVMMWLATERARTYFALGPQVGARVSRHAMASLLRGQHPVTGAVIRKAGRYQGESVMVGGIDVTINPAPKSVSVLWAMADDELRRQIEKHVYLKAGMGRTRPQSSSSLRSSEHVGGPGHHFPHRAGDSAERDRGHPQLAPPTAQAPGPVDDVHQDRPGCGGRLGRSLGSDAAVPGLGLAATTASSLAPCRPMAKHCFA
jgi:hypothetical protein